MKPTSGPWITNNAEQEVQGDGIIICKPWKYRGRDEACANARLIATAPDGLALAHMVLAEVECYCEFDRPGLAKGLCAHCTAKALIAKAEGKQ